jgi:hypothetical protein
MGGVTRLETVPRVAKNQSFGLYREEWTLCIVPYRYVYISVKGKMHMARRISVFMVAGALLLVLVAGVAMARTFQCGKFEYPCEGTNQDDVITERQGNSVRDDISSLAGRDIIRAQVFRNDNDILNSDQDNDRVRADDGDSRDAIDCGEGENDVAIVDEGDAVNFSNCEDVRGGISESPSERMVPENPNVDVSDAVLAK